MGPAQEHVYHEAMGLLKLQPLHEPGDVDSLLLKSQIVEHFWENLRTMAAARAQLQETVPVECKTKKEQQQNATYLPSQIACTQAHSPRAP
jgi:hypothetical protein